MKPALRLRLELPRLSPPPPATRALPLGSGWPLRAVGAAGPGTPPCEAAVRAACGPRAGAWNRFGAPERCGRPTLESHGPSPSGAVRGV